jgi:hypothetical protein
MGKDGVWGDVWGAGCKHGIFELPPKVPPAVVGNVTTLEPEEGDECISKCEAQFTELTDSVAKLMLNHPMESMDPAATKKNTNTLNVSCSIATAAIPN